MVRELGQPSLLIDVARAKIARHGIDVSDVEAVISAAVGGRAATQVIQAVVAPEGFANFKSLA